MSFWRAFFRGFAFLTSFEELRRCLKGGRRLPSCSTRSRLTAVHPAPHTYTCKVMDLTDHANDDCHYCHFAPNDASSSEALCPRLPRTQQWPGKNRSSIFTFATLCRLHAQGTMASLNKPTPRCSPPDVIAPPD